jgi:hypothetical protein
MLVSKTIEGCRLLSEQTSMIDIEGRVLFDEDNLNIPEH